jgi:hypothetical protein
MVWSSVNMYPQNTIMQSFVPVSYILSWGVHGVTRWFVTPDLRLHHLISIGKPDDSCLIICCIFSPWDGGTGCSHTACPSTGLIWQDFEWVSMGVTVVTTYCLCESDDLSILSALGYHYLFYVARYLWDRRTSTRQYLPPLLLSHCTSSLDIGVTKSDDKSVTSI